jgi:DNA polymerase III epsilon subunit-like protein
MSEMHRLEMDIEILKDMKQYCTMREGKNITKIKNEYGYKFPKLSELCDKLSVISSDQHRAMGDVQSTLECYLKMMASIEKEKPKISIPSKKEKPKISYNKQEYDFQEETDPDMGIWFGYEENDPDMGIYMNDRQ